MKKSSIIFLVSALIVYVMVASAAVFAEDEVVPVQESSDVDTNKVYENAPAAAEVQAPVVEETVVKTNAEASDYTIIKGDCLWDLSYKFYNTPWKWREIWNANSAIKNPNLIYPYDKLVIPGFTGAQGAPSSPASDTKQVSAAPEQTAEQVQPAENGEEQEEVVAEEVESEYVEEADKPVSVEMSGVTQKNKFKDKYMEDSFVVPVGWEYDGYVVGSGEKKLMISSGDIIFMDIGTDLGLQPGNRCGIYRIGKNIKSKSGNKIVGRMIKKVAIVELTADIEESASTARVISCNDYLKKGDLVRIIR